MIKGIFNAEIYCLSDFCSNNCGFLNYEYEKLKAQIKNCIKHNEKLTEKQLKSLKKFDGLFIKYVEKNKSLDGSAIMFFLFVVDNEIVSYLDTHVKGVKNTTSVGYDAVYTNPSYRKMGFTSVGIKRITNFLFNKGNVSIVYADVISESSKIMLSKLDYLVQKNQKPSEFCIRVYNIRSQSKQKLMKKMKLITLKDYINKTKVTLLPVEEIEEMFTFKI
jgi:hypothetical protein